MTTPHATNPTPASLRRIADELGLSMMTVSRAVRGVAGVSEKARRQVMEVAQRMHYTPNKLVTGIRTGRTWTAGVMMPVENRFFAEIIGGVYGELAESKYAMLLSALPIEYSNKGDMDHLMPMIERRVDGLIFRATDDQATDKHFSELWRRRIPFVTVDRQLPSAHCDFVGTDDYNGGVIAARHLLALGHRKVGQLAGPDSVSTARNRRRGFEDTIKAAGGTCSTIEMTDFVNRESAHRILTQNPRPTAIFCVNDMMAYDLYVVARELGINIPDDLSVVGFADLPESSLASPGLTTIRQDPHAIGRRAVQILLKRITSKDVNAAFEMIQLMPSLVVRESTAAPQNQS